MSRRVLGAAFSVACLIASTASGQAALGVARTPGVTVHRPEPPPEEPAPPSARPSHRHDRHPDPPPPGSDLFLAGPDTYAPHNNRRPRRFNPYRGFTGYVPAAYTPSVVETVIVPAPIIIEREPRPRETTVDRETPPTPEPIVIYVTPPAPKTLYVIPRCYAGDRRPSADQLPAGCDLSLLRIIPASAQ